MTTPDIAGLCERLRAALEGVTPGPWLYRPSKLDDWGWVCAADRGFICQAKDPSARDDETLDEHRRAGTDPWGANAAFIALSREAVPALLCAIERQAAEIGRLREGLERIAAYKWPDIIGEQVTTSHGEYSGEPYENKFPVARETGSQAFLSAQSIARAALTGEDT